MKKYFIMFAIFLVLHIPPTLADDICLEVTKVNLNIQFGGPYSEVMLGDGRLVVAGWKTVGDNPSAQAVLLCFDVDGKEIWRFETQDNLKSQFAGLLSLADGSFVTIQHREIPMGDTSDYIQRKYDIIHVAHDGSFINKPAFETQCDSFFPRLFAAKNGYFVFSGEREESNANDEMITFPSLEYRDNAGNINWKHFFTHALYLYGVLPIEDGYLLYGLEIEQQVQSFETRAVIFKMSDQGKVLWRIVIPGENWPAINEAVQMPDGKIIAFGIMERTVFKNGKKTAPRSFQYCISSDGALCWQKEYAPNDPGYLTFCLHHTDNGFVALIDEYDLQAPLRLALFGTDGEIVQEFQTHPHGTRTESSFTLKATNDAFYLLEHYRPEGMMNDYVFIMPVDQVVGRPITRRIDQ